MFQIRGTVDPNATVRLRMDDPVFEAALANEAGDLYDKLKTLLGGPPEDVDLSPYVDAGVWIDARESITGDEDDKIANVSQQEDARQGIRVDVVAANKRLFSTWAVAVGDDNNAIDWPPKLSHRQRQQREEGAGMLPVGLRDLLLARLRVHIDAATRPALRDEAKTTGKTGSRSSGTTHSFGGDHADAQPASD